MLRIFDFKSDLPNDVVWPAPWQLVRVYAIAFVLGAGCGGGQTTPDSGAADAATTCGDGVTDANEQCDDGNAVDTDACTNSCEDALCGDGIVWAAVEACDDGNAVDTDGCTQGCNAIGWVALAAGSFTMGSPDTEPNRDIGEAQHSVTLTHPFWMQATEVTQAQWSHLVAPNPSVATACGDDCPVDSTNWYDALTYANLLSTSEGLAPCYTLSGCTGAVGVDLDCTGAAVNTVEGNPYLCEGYRLPTEAEWEYAYRAGATTAFYNGAMTESGCSPVDPNLDAIAWFCGNAAGATHPVAGKQGNVWGLFDMPGNVYEWSWDWTGDYPGDVTDPFGPPSGTLKVIRGGGYGSVPGGCRAAWRGYDFPYFRGPNLGFRLARTAL